MALDVFPMMQGSAIGDALGWQKEAKKKCCLAIQFSLQKT
jgi:hypothetical protein